MDKDKVLPVIYKPGTGRPFELQGAEEQRDADWVILERDYVAKERVKQLLVELGYGEEKRQKPIPAEWDGFINRQDRETLEEKP